MDRTKSLKSVIFYIFYHCKNHSSDKALGSLYRDSIGPESILKWYSVQFSLATALLIKYRASELAFSYYCSESSKILGSTFQDASVIK